MNTYRYRKIDAFASGQSTGNPAACIHLGDGESLDDSAMQAIAKQHKGFVSEVVYCFDQAGDYTLRYFSSECEVEFCGHGTIACMYDLIRRTPALMEKETVRFRTRAKGVIPVFNHIPDQDAVFITAPAPVYREVSITPAEAARGLQIPQRCLDNNLPVDCIDAGLRTLIVPLAALADEIALFPDEAALKQFCLDTDIDIILIHCSEVADKAHFAHTRVFAPRFGYLEDPATGSGNSAFGYYLLKNKLWNGSPIAIEQGGNDRVFNTVKMQIRDGAVLFGGSAVTRIDGLYYY
ncbi:MAG: PhzF family phenazine biosynthesis protein [Planctomycetes bacterium]|nr:PhzF family phenazine biosynthesis protein [Planctomycetota bacterium]